MVTGSNRPNRRKVLTAAIAAAGILLVYLGSYMALLERVDGVVRAGGTVKYLEDDYSLLGSSGRLIYYPINRIDRICFPDRWKAVSSMAPPPETGRAIGDYSGEGDNRSNCGDRLGYVGCWRDLGNAMIDSYTGGHGGVPGIPRPGGKLGVGDESHEDYENKKDELGPGPQNREALTSAWNTLVHKAKADCESKETCCDRITVYVDCDSDMRARSRDADAAEFCDLRQVFRNCR